ncbi:hypothetical protein C8J56DRAFT_900037 [Mycena floridula]|nr:hypothetical protein C8J56DRAFT_900037 [Mycena floridula]
MAARYKVEIGILNVYTLWGLIMASKSSQIDYIVDDRDEMNMTATHTMGYIHEVAGRLGIPLYQRNGSVFQVKVDRYIDATPSSALAPEETVDSHVGHQFTGEWLGGDVVLGVVVCVDVEGGLRRRNAGAAEVEETRKWRLGCRDAGCIDVREWLVSVYSRGSNSMTGPKS